MPAPSGQQRESGTTTLAEELLVEDVNEEDLCEAMDWRLARQKQIETKLAARHSSDGALMLHDVISSYGEGKKCPLTKFGRDRDGRKHCPLWFMV